MLPEPLEIACRDGVVLKGHLWPRQTRTGHGQVVINPATGVLATYYHRYARFLSGHGFDVVTYDYRGIGASRPSTLRRCRYRWRDWGAVDFDAVLEMCARRDADAPLMVVGHSIGGFLPGFSSRAGRIDRMLTVGAQYAWWRDYAIHARLRLAVKWHVVMPVMTAMLGYFPGRRLGWLEDLPRGVANEWSFRRSRMERSYRPVERDAVLASFPRVVADILAVAVTDDELGTQAAVERGLSYYTSASRQTAMLTPSDLSVGSIGHFGLFHERFKPSFWLDTIMWLRDGRNPWPDRPFPPRQVYRTTSTLPGA